MKNKKGKTRKTKKKTTSIKFPASLLAPVGKFLQDRLRLLEKRRKNIEKEDPFKDQTRVLDNASPDTDAAEQFGHARSSAIKTEIDKKIIREIWHL
jgi:hypothetical protein